MQSKFRDLAVKISQLLYGRNGFDRLSGFLLILSLIANIANSFIRARPASAVLSAVSLALFAIAVYRVLSKNIGKRQNENFKFENLLKLLNFDKTVGKIKNRAKNLNLRIKYVKTNRFRKCPNCKSFLRLKNKRGKREINCPNCGRKMKVRIWL
jgi:hypothetical protein